MHTKHMTFLTVERLHVDMITNDKQQSIAL